MKNVSKNYLENLRIGLNVKEKQKIIYKKITKKTYNKAQQQLHLLYHEFCIYLKT